MKSKVLIAGTFDPITKGHMDLVARAAKEYDQVTIGIFINPEKTCMFSLETRLRLVELAIQDYQNVDVISDSGYTADFAKEHCYTLLRGYRNREDLAYEENMAAFNLARAGIHTILLPCTEDVSLISSSRVRAAIAQSDWDTVKELVPAPCLPLLVEDTKV